MGEDHSHCHQGLHRDLCSRDSHSSTINRRRRIWGAVLIADRWSSASNGQPMCIHLSDCDAKGPSAHDDAYHGIDDAILGVGPPPRRPYALHCQITKVRQSISSGLISQLSEFLGRICWYCRNSTTMTVAVAEMFSSIRIQSTRHAVDI